MKKLFCILSMILLLLPVLLSSCKKEEEPLLIDDQEMSEISGTAAETGEEEPEGDMAASEDGRPDRIVPVPKNLTSDRLVQEFAYSPDFYHNEEHAFVIDGNSIYYVRNRNIAPTEENDYETSGAFLYCADKNSGDSRLCCSKPGCEHNSRACGAYMCRSEDVQGMSIDDGVLWYIWSSGSFDETEFHVSCMDLETEKRMTPWKIELQLIADPNSPDTGSSRPMHAMCSFFNGYIITLQSSARWNRAAFGEFMGNVGNTDHALITAWKIPDSMNTSGQETVLIPACEILEEKYPDMYRQRVYVQPYGDDLYILQAGETTEDLKADVDTWNMQYGFSLLRWRPGDEEPEVLAESGEYSVWNYWVTDEGILLLEFEDMNEVHLVRLNPEKKTEEVLGAGNIWWLGEVKFSDELIISFEDEDAGFSRPKSRTQVCRIYDLSGKFLTEYAKPIIDPRLPDPDKAGEMYSIRYTMDSGGVYMGWKEGIMYYPFDEEKPVWFFGYTQ